MKLYVAGPMSGLPDFNYPAFFNASKQLREAGYEVENPAENKPEGDASWLAFMRMSLVQISKVDGLALLPSWQTSKGARLEEEIGQRLGLTVRYVGWWLSPEALAEHLGTPFCPECAQGKVVNCALLALDPKTDELVECASVGAIA